MSLVHQGIFNVQGGHCIANGGHSLGHCQYETELEQKCKLF